MKKCLICKSSVTLLLTYRNAIYKKTFMYFKCGDCGHIFLTPKLPDKELFNHYIYEKNDDGQSSLVKQIIKVIFESNIYTQLFSSKRFIKIVIRKYNKLFNHLPKSYLDYGSGNSKAAEYFKEMLPKSTCSRFEKSINATNSEGIKIFKSEKLLLKNAIKYEVISLFHVLEHVQNIPKLFSILRSISSKNTLFLFQIPQAAGLDMACQPYLHNTFILHNPYHLNLFTTKSIGLTLEKYNFKVINIQYEIYQTHSLLDGQNILLKLLLTPLMFSISILAKYLKKSNVITVYAQKK